MFCIITVAYEGKFIFKKITIEKFDVNQQFVLFFAIVLVSNLCTKGTHIFLIV